MRNIKQYFCKKPSNFIQISFEINFRIKISFTPWNFGIQKSFGVVWYENAVIFYFVAYRDNFIMQNKPMCALQFVAYLKHKQASVEIPRNAGSLGAINHFFKKHFLS